MSRTGRTRLTTAATVAGTLVVVVLEMALLTGIWHLGDGLDRQREARSVLTGTLATLTTPAAPADLAAVRSAVDGLRPAGVDTAPGSAGAAVVSAADVLAADPGDPAALAGLRRADTALGADLADATTARAWTAFGIHAGLLVAVSIGWFVWFRRLVDRHRALERRLTAQQVVDRHERRLLALVQNSADVVLVLESDGTASFASPSSRAVLGRDPEDLVGRGVVAGLGPDTRPLLGLLAQGRVGDQPVRVQVEHADGRTLVTEGTLTNLLDDPSVAAWVLTLRDVTEQTRLAEQLSHQAFHDALTGLANRALFADRLEHALTRRGRTQPCAVLFVDLDDFKEVNDAHGHTVGDRLLIAATDRIRGALGPGDTAARLGGDEFAVLLEDTGADAAETVAHRLLEALAAPVDVGEVRWSVRASIGLAVAAAGTRTGEEVLRDADVAMYWAKEDGKGTVARYDESRHAAALAVIALQHELPRAIEEGELVVHFQPTVTLSSGAITGFEALVRWEHPTLGLLPPSQFVPAAERSGQILALGAWVLRSACAAATELQRPDHPVSMAVNVSADQLASPTFIDEVRLALSDSGLPGNLLTLEVTESVVLGDVVAAGEALGALRSLGVSVAIDDFGTGYSSLSYLSRLPVDILKVDKSFIDKIGLEGHTDDITLAILEMSRTMRMVTVAEGVETAEQASWLQDRACGVGQGYFWSRPVPLAQARELLHAPSSPARLTRVAG